MQQNALKQIGQITSQTNAVKANDETVLRSLYESNYHIVERFVLKNNGCIDEAKDIYQEAFIIMWRNIQLDKFYPKNENALDAYLCQIARNKWMDHLRSKLFKNKRPLGDLAHKLSDDPVEEEDSRFIIDIKKNFEKLGKNCKEAISPFGKRLLKAFILCVTSA